MKGMSLLRKFIREEIGRNYHTTDNDPHTWDSFQDYRIEKCPQENGQYTLELYYKDEQLVPNTRFPNETECDSYARQVIDKHRIIAMNNE